MTHRFCLIDEWRDRREALRASNLRASLNWRNPGRNLYFSHGLIHLSTLNPRGPLHGRLHPLETTRDPFALCNDETPCHARSRPGEELKALKGWERKRCPKGPIARRLPLYSLLSGRRILSPIYIWPHLGFGDGGRVSGIVNCEI